MFSDKKSRSQIIWALRNFYPELGGASERFRRYLPGLNQRGVDVSIICTTRNNKIPCGNLIEDGIPIQRVFLPETTPSISDLTLAKVAVSATKSQILNKENHVIQFFGIRASMLPYLWRMKLRGYKIIQVITLLSDKERAHHPISPKGIAKIFRNRLTERVSSKIIVSSKIMGEDRIRLGASPKQVQVISNGVDLIRFSPVSIESKYIIREKLNIPQSVFSILYMGTITPRKRVEWVIQAFLQIKKTHSHARLYLVGPLQRPTMHNLVQASRQTHYQSELEKIAGEELNRTIFFVGETEEPENWFRAADVFVFSSIIEGLGNVLLEAMACGLPIVTTSFIGLAEELGRGGQEFLLTSESIESITDAINSIIIQNDFRIELIKNALSHVALNHDLEKTLDLYAGIYNS